MKGKIGSDLHINFYDITELKQHCHATFSVISDVLHAMEGRGSNTAANYSFMDENQ